MAREYISVDSLTKEASQLVKMTNKNNEFHGTLKTQQDGEMKDVKDIFIQGATVNGNPVDIEDDNGKQILDIQLPQGYGETNVIEEIWVNGEYQPVNNKKVEITIDTTPATPVAATKVFKATDSLGSTPVDDLEITPSDAPANGDILIVTHPLGNGENEYTAYIWAETEWLACSGKMDAAKVIFTENLMMAGDYSNIGNFKNTYQGNTGFLENGRGTKGVSVQELFKQMFCKTLNPYIYSMPQASISFSPASGGSMEYGETKTISYSIGFTDGTYKYEGGSIQQAGCTAVGYNVTGGSSETSRTGTITLSAGETKTVSANVSYTGGTNPPVNNLGQVASIETISPGYANVSGSVSASAYRKSFMKVLPFGGTITPEEINSLTSDQVRSYQSANALPTQLSVTNGFQVLVFVPSNKTPTAKTQDGLPYSIDKVKVGGTDVKISVNGANNYAATDYYVWEIMSQSTFSDTIKFTWA